MPGRKIHIFLLLLAGCFESFSQQTDTTSFTMNSRLNFYSWEKADEFILQIPSYLQKTRFEIHISLNDREISSWSGIPGKLLLVIAARTDLAPGNYSIIADIESGSGKKYQAKSMLTILSPKSNEVKVDRLTGGLIVNRRQFFPFGFYCYSPVDPELPEEEVVRGFNMISPYQKILPSTLDERKAYMDRCAQLGMKVHYNLLSVSGGGGVASMIDGISEEKQKELLVQEIRTFMNHPALLSWYISDEPNGNKIEPEKLEKIYKLVKSLDPWHPVSIVFMAPFRSALRYSDATDIVMADPYPVPEHPITLPGETAMQLRNEFEGKKPVWIVPQAFGGGEVWSREPTVHEIRTMTYQAIVGGARGIQFFVRQGPNSFPKSTAMWDECGKMAQEINTLTPWLLSDEPSIQVRTGTPGISILTGVHDGQLMIIAVNSINSPVRINMQIYGKISGNAQVLFENRSIKIPGNNLSDIIPAYGSQVYLTRTGSEKVSIHLFKGNLLKDPGFEDISSPGVPASCYAWNEGDKGATYVLDSRDHTEGNYSLRIITPADNAGSRLKFFPIKVSSGKTYGISVDSRSDNTIQHPDNGKQRQACFELGFAGSEMKRFHPGPEWENFVTFVTIPEDAVPGKANVVLRVPREGVVWFDMLQVFEATDINRSINPELIKDLINE